MATISVNALTLPAGAQTIALTYGNVTFNASGSFITGYGYYADGLPYVVCPIGHVTFSSISPAQSTAPDGSVINGAGRNVTSDSQPWDQRFVGYSSAKQVDANTKFYANDVCVKLVSRNTDQNAAYFDQAEQRGGIGEYAACFVLDAAPAANTMSPSPIGWAGRTTLTGYVLTDSLDNIAASLHGTYTSAGQDIVSAPSSYKYAAPGIAVSRGGLSEFEYRRFAPYGYYGGQYGRNIARGQAYLALGIMTDAWTVAQAKAALTHLIQLGIALYDSGAGVGSPKYGYGTATPEGNGGHYQYALMPTLFALKYTGRTASITTSLRNIIPTNELWQPFAVTSGLVSETYTEHDSTTQMSTSRRRQITNISGNTITLEQHAEDATRFHLAGHQMVLSGSPSVRTTITEGAFGSSIMDQNIVVADATGFSIGNDVYLTPSWAIQEGDHEWNFSKPTERDSFQSGADHAHSYLASQIWYGPLVTMRALGLYDASVFGDFEQYCLRAFRPNQPSDTIDRNDPSWYTDQGIDGHLHASSWTRAFHAAHAATIFPDWSAAAPTLSSSSPTDNATGVAVGANITLTFSESVRFGYGTITLRENNGGWADLEVFDIANPAGFGTGAGQISISGSTLTINPTADLTASREYAIQVGSGAITNLKYVPYAGIADDTTLSFTTA